MASLELLSQNYRVVLMDGGRKLAFSLDTRDSAAAQANPDRLRASWEASELPNPRT